MSPGRFWLLKVRNGVGDTSFGGFAISDQCVCECVSTKAGFRVHGRFSTAEVFKIRVLLMHPDLTASTTG